jgi:hypothetical protein
VVSNGHAATRWEGRLLAACACAGGLAKRAPIEIADELTRMAGLLACAARHSRRRLTFGECVRAADPRRSHARASCSSSTMPRAVRRIS